MKKIFGLALGIFFCTLTFAQDMPGMKMPQKQNKNPAKKNTNTNSSESIIYTCVMHPQIKMNKPGNCPICGMKLVKKVIKNAPPKNVPEKKEEVNKPIDPSSKMEMKMDSSKEIKMDNMKMNPPVIKIKEEKTEKVNLAPGKAVRYDLYVTDTIVNFTGKHKHALAINGSIPAPILTFTEGDTAEIYLHNMLQTETSLHWHGIILPNRADGVPYLTTSKIPAGTTHLYKFPIVQNGTYWYHSHTKLQEQAGMYGALILKKRNEPAIKTYPIILSDWTDEKPSEVQRRLHAGTDWYAIKKGSTQSYTEAIKKGFFATKISNEWKRMKAMDVSDVYYEKFLLNGKPENAAPQFKAGEKVKLRIVNGSSSTYFWLQYAGSKLTVVANDGNDVEPVVVDRMIVGIAETYDVIVTIPENMSYEFKATAEDRTNSASLWLGSGMKMPAPVLPKLKYFDGMKMMNSMMKMNGDMKDMGMQMSNQTMDMNTVMYPEITGEEKPTKDATAKDNGNKQGEMKAMPGMDMSSSSDIVTLNYGMIRSPVKTTLPNASYKQLRFELTGNMNRYVWSINNKTVNEWDKILIEKGQNVRIVLFNNSMMRHPMHLHGHNFRVLNGQGEYAPLKNVIDIMPMETDTLEFAATESGDWFFHCHILYHMMAGMGNVFHYINSPPNPELPDPAKAYRDFKKDNHMIHTMAKIGLESNGSDAEFMLAGNRYALQGMWHLGTMPHHGYEAELNFGRYLGKMQWWFPYVGLDYHYKMVEGIKSEKSDYKNLFGQVSNKDDRKTFVAGLQYTLPMLLVADGRIDGNGKLRFQLSREDVPLSKRLRFSLMANTDKEYAAGFRYIISKWFSLSTHYDSDMGLGAGITITY